MKISLDSCALPAQQALQGVIISLDLVHLYTGKIQSKSIE
jgi:hypothetical protein